ncbi:phage recombination protein Bet [Prosthecobacter debontii]|uniref:Phage recombination protein Bet n=1 Tax=Prosthecobacter debontii TaxID=48467 RepID=A0A1T4X6Q8_9BACT|nr:phage recombination protein Bet [Prosthecobacter debontii]SKA84735.1 phage recombination protein Bet [Prosthecobacter debontii]
MSTAIITQDAIEYTEEQRRLITDVLCKGASPVEVEFFMQVAQRCKLDPFRRQIHAVKRWDSKAKRETLTFQVGIDGLRAIAARTGEYAGNDDPVFVTESNVWHPTKATVTVYRMVHGQRIPFTSSVFWDEYVQTTREGAVTSMWQQRPFGQLGKCAEAAALRKAFPEESGGLYTEEEFREDHLPQPPPQPASPKEPPVYAEVTIKEPEPKPAPTTMEAETVEDPETPKLYDLLDAIREATTPEALKEFIADAEAFTVEKHKAAAKRTIQNRAKALGLTWDTATTSFIKIAK